MWWRGGAGARGGWGEDFWLWWWGLGAIWGVSLIFCSISCSCLRAFKNAAFKRAVCSALSSFFTLTVLHFSHTVTSSESLPGLFVQEGEKSVLQREQTLGFINCSRNGTLCFPLASLAAITSTTDSSPTKSMKSWLPRLGINDHSGGGGFGGGIWSSVLSNCFRSAILAAACFPPGLCWWELLGKWCWNDTYPLLAGRLLTLLALTGVGRTGAGWFAAEYAGLPLPPLWGYRGVGWIRFAMQVTTFCRSAIADDPGFECDWVECWWMDCCTANSFRVWAAGPKNFEDPEFEDCDWALLLPFGSSLGCPGTSLGGWKVEVASTVEAFKGGGGGRFWPFLGGSRHRGLHRLGRRSLCPYLLHIFFLKFGATFDIILCSM